MKSTVTRPSAPAGGSTVTETSEAVAKLNRTDDQAKNRQDGRNHIDSLKTAAEDGKQKFKVTLNRTSKVETEVKAGQTPSDGKKTKEVKAVKITRSYDKSGNKETKPKQDGADNCTNKDDKPELPTTGQPESAKQDQNDERQDDQSKSGTVSFSFKKTGSKISSSTAFTTEEEASIETNNANSTKETNNHKQEEETKDQSKPLSQFVKVMNKDETLELDWPVAMIQHTKTEPVISFSCDPITFDFSQLLMKPKISTENFPTPAKSDPVEKETAEKEAVETKEPPAAAVVKETETKTPAKSHKKKKRKKSKHKKVAKDGEEVKEEKKTEKKKKKKKHKSKHGDEKKTEDTEKNHQAKSESKTEEKTEIKTESKVENKPDAEGAAQSDGEERKKKHKRTKHTKKGKKKRKKSHRGEVAKEEEPQAVNHESDKKHKESKKKGDDSDSSDEENYTKDHKRKKRKKKVVNKAAEKTPKSDQKKIKVAVKRSYTSEEDISDLEEKTLTKPTPVSPAVVSASPAVANKKIKKEPDSGSERKSVSSVRKRQTSESSVNDTPVSVKKQRVTPRLTPQSVKTDNSWSKMEDMLELKNVQDNTKSKWDSSDSEPDPEPVKPTKTTESSSTTTSRQNAQHSKHRSRSRTRSHSRSRRRSYSSSSSRSRSRSYSSSSYSSRSRSYSRSRSRSYRRRSRSRSYSSYTDDSYSRSRSRSYSSSSSYSRSRSRSRRHRSYSRGRSRGSSYSRSRSRSSSYRHSRSRRRSRSYSRSSRSLSSLRNEKVRRRDKTKTEKEPTKSEDPLDIPLPDFSKEDDGRSPTNLRQKVQEKKQQHSDLVKKGITENVEEENKDNLNTTDFNDIPLPAVEQGCKNNPEAQGSLTLPPPPPPPGADESSYYGYNGPPMDYSQGPMGQPMHHGHPMGRMPPPHMGPPMRNMGPPRQGMGPPMRNMGPPPGNMGPGMRMPPPHRMPPGQRMYPPPNRGPPPHHGPGMGPPRGPPGMGPPPHHMHNMPPHMRGPPGYHHQPRYPPMHEDCYDNGPLERRDKSPPPLPPPRSPSPQPPPPPKKEEKPVEDPVPNPSIVIPPEQAEMYKKLQEQAQKHAVKQLRRQAAQEKGETISESESEEEEEQQLEVEEEEGLMSGEEEPSMEELQQPTLIAIQSPVSQPTIMIAQPQPASAFGLAPHAQLMSTAGGHHILINPHSMAMTPSSLGVPVQAGAPMIALQQPGHNMTVLAHAAAAAGAQPAHLPGLVQSPVHLASGHPGLHIAGHQPTMIAHPSQISQLSQLQQIQQIQQIHQIQQIQQAQQLAAASHMVPQHQLLTQGGGPVIVGNQLLVPRIVRPTI